MKFIDEFRDSEIAGRLADEIWRITTAPHSIMEVCGGQTHAIMKYAISDLIPGGINLIHGPGCPVCVTSMGLIDKAVEIALNKEVIFCTFGDMMRVPGKEMDLLAVKTAGGDVRIVYSPLDALKIAVNNPSKEVVFFAIGFETTAPANGLAVFQANKNMIKNFSVLVSQMLIPPAMEAILQADNCEISSFLAPGHVCAITGQAPYEQLTKAHQVPIAITGFEPADILSGILGCVEMLEKGKAEVQNRYSRAVRKNGNIHAQRIIKEMFRVITRRWRGIGGIPRSGLGLREKYSDFDAENRFGPAIYHHEYKDGCISGLILQGLKRPDECPAFAGRCSPEHPLGATMVSSEGTCAAYYHYKKLKTTKEKADEINDQ